MYGKRVIWPFLFVLAAAGGLWILRDAIFGEPNPARVPIDAKSTNLKRDLEVMWETQALANPDESHGANPRCSTDRAINAASRVFNSVELVGKSKNEVIAILGDPKSSSDSTYDFPFYPPVSRESLVYRFDSGAYGWQFDVAFGGDERVKEVERQWIE